jgi:hypothetical protein
MAKMSESKAVVSHRVPEFDRNAHAQNEHFATKIATSRWHRIGCGDEAI